MNQSFKQDYYRMTGKPWNLCSYLNLLFRYDLRYLRHLRTRRGGEKYTHCFRLDSAVSTVWKYYLKILGKAFISDTHIILMCTRMLLSVKTVI